MTPWKQIAINTFKRSRKDSFVVVTKVGQSGAEMLLWEVHFYPDRRSSYHGVIARSVSERGAKIYATKYLNKHARMR